MTRFHLSISGHRFMMNGDYFIIPVFRASSIVMVKRPSDVPDNAWQLCPVSLRQPGTFSSRYVLLLLLTWLVEPSQIQHEAADKN